MHEKIISELSEAKLRVFAKESLDYIKLYNHEMYEEIEYKLYVEMYGHHFTKWLLDEALCCLENEDGTKGGHWTLEQTNSVARNKGVQYTNFNEYDFCYTMNMIYSDYYGAVRDDVENYYNLSIKFLKDKDFGEGKAFCYYMMTKNNK